MNRVSTNFRDGGGAVGADVEEASSRDAINRVCTQEYTWVRIVVDVESPCHSLPRVTIRCLSLPEPETRCIASLLVVYSDAAD